ncbi:MAG: aldo/keto reductase [Cypionkella sp.]
MGMSITSSRLAFGTMQFGGRADAAQSAAMFDACLDAGVTHFDTACGYNGGASETILGQLAARVRARVYIATKLGYVGGAGRENLSLQMDASRKRLGLDCVDLLYLHRYDPRTPLVETLETFAQFQARGWVRHIGLSNFPAWAVVKAQGIARSLGTRIDAIQPMYSLIKRQAEVELLPMAADLGLAVFAYSPLGAGLLTGKYSAGGEEAIVQGRLAEDARYAQRYSDPSGHRAAIALAGIAQALGTHPATLAVAWAMAHPSAPCPIISGRNAAQLAPALAAMAAPLPPDLYRALSALMPPPPSATDRSEEA